MEKKKQLSLEQISAIEMARRIGEKIVSDYPEIADDYRQGNTLNEIAEKYNIPEKYAIPYRNVRRCLQSAIKILISKEERKSLKRQHLQKSFLRNYKEGIGIFSFSSEKLKKMGRKLYEKKKGIHSQSKEEKIENAGKGGRKAYELGLGVHALSNKERKEFGRKGALVIGRKPFSDEERIYFFELCENQEYQYEAGGNKGKPNYKLISEELERKFGIKRSTITLTDIMYRFRKEKDDQR